MCSETCGDVAKSRLDLDQLIPFGTGSVPVAMRPNGIRDRISIRRYTAENTKTARTQV